MIISKLVFEKEGATAERFFKTSHTSFYRFPDGEILTVTSYEKRVSPLGVAGMPLQPNWIAVESGKLVFENVVIDSFQLYDPKVKKITKISGCRRYFDILLEKSGKDFLRIFERMKRGDFSSIVGLGPGLTPLGDDILSGMASVGFKLDFPIRTSDISRQQILHAVKGYVPLPVKEFLENGIEDGILEMGATSGAGWAFGITYLLEGC